MNEEEKNLVETINVVIEDDRSLSDWLMRAIVKIHS